MAISVGIRRIVVLSDYPEDGTPLLREAGIELVKLEPERLKPWVTIIPQDSEASARAVTTK
jgi:dCMP deaminase